MDVPSVVMDATHDLRGPSCLSLSQNCGQIGIWKALFRRRMSAGSVKLFKGGIISWYRQRLVLTSDASPAAAPACPIFGFTDPNAHGLSLLSEFFEKKLLSASDSTESCSLSALPWVSI